MRSEAVVRCAGERTTDACIRSVARQMPVTTIQVSPFLEAVKTTFDIGINSKADLLFAVDADMVLTYSARRRVEEAWTDPDVIYMNCRIRDRFRGDKVVGVHVYRTSYCGDFLEELYRRENRARDTTQGRMENRPVEAVVKRLGKKRVVYPQPIALHDYEQYLNDLYRKGFTRATREKDPKALILRLMNIYRHDMSPYMRGLSDGSIPGAKEITNFQSFPKFYDKEIEPLTEMQIAELIEEADKL